MSDVSEAFETILNLWDGCGERLSALENSCGSHTSRAQFGDLCQVLAENLVEARESCQPEESFSLRDALGDDASSIVPLLGALLQDRVNKADLLPSTQDAAANEEVLDSEKSAMTLTLPALQAALLYAQLLVIPGALGGGLVELEWLTGLSAVLRRWTLECCGREDCFRLEQHSAESSVHDLPGDSPPKKRSRRACPAKDTSSFSDTDAKRPSPVRAMLQLGLRVALGVCQIPFHREFLSWSSEAREVVLSTLTISMGTAAALQSKQHHLPSMVVSEASKALQSCMLHCNEKIKLQHEIAVTCLRGLLHLLQFREVVPCGERGKLDAHDGANQILITLLETLACASTSRKSRRSLGDATNQHTPSLKRLSNAGRKTPGTTGRTSFSGTENLKGAITPLRSPAVKGRRSSFASQISIPGYVKPGPVWSVFVGMLQKLSTTPGMERASARTPIVQVLVKSISALPLCERTHFLRDLLKLARSRVSLHRLTTVELFGSLLCQDWISTHSEDSVEAPSPEGIRALEIRDVESPLSRNENEGLSLPVALWKALQGRLADKLAAVRVRAALSIESVVVCRKEFVEDSLVLNLQKRATRDETATVRKAAVQALRQILLVKENFLSDLHVTTFCDLCQDSSLLVRKAAAESITLLLETFSNHPTVGSMMERAWSSSVLPMVLDEEISSRAIASLDRIVVTPLLTESSEDKVDTAWRLLANVAKTSALEGSCRGSQTALEKGLQQMALEDSTRVFESLSRRAALTAETLLKEVETSAIQVSGVWCLLQALLSDKKRVTDVLPTMCSSIDLASVCDGSWKKLLRLWVNDKSMWIISTLRSCFFVVSRLAPGLKPEAVTHLNKGLKKEMMDMKFPTQVIGAATQAISTLLTCSSPKEAQLLSKQWIESMFKAAEAEITSFVRGKDHNGMEIIPADQERVVRALFTVGELSMLGFIQDEDQGLTKDATLANSDALRGFHIKPPKSLQRTIQALLPPTFPGKHQTEIPSRIRAHAFTVLGKLCLRDEALADSSLNLLARELHPSVQKPNRAVQSNALLVMGDLCVKYTNMADRYLPIMASCLQAGSLNPEVDLFVSADDGSSVVRKHAVLLLSSLLLQDYIKWRGLLFHRFLVACSDENEEVAMLAENVLSGPLSLRNPRLFFNHFVEAVFVLNKCSAHPIYVAAASHGDGGSGIAVGFEGIHLDGEVGRLRRRHMYDFLLGKLSDEEKIGITARLAKEVLVGAVDSDSDLGRVCERSKIEGLEPNLESAWNVLSDTFAILTGKLIRVARVQEEDVVEDPNIPNPSRQMTVAKTRLLSKISRKHLIEIVFPILCNLKTKLQSSFSPLLKDLMKCMIEIFKAYKNEIQEVLANEPTLLQEIEYDARNYAD